MTMYLAWYDNNKKRSIEEKVEIVIARYREKFGTDPDVCLVNEQDVDALREKLAIQVKGVSFIPRDVFYVGTEQEEI